MAARGWNFNEGEADGEISVSRSLGHDLRALQPRLILEEDPTE